MANYSHQHNLRGRRPAPPPPLQPIRDAWMFNNSQPPRSSEEVCLISKWSFRVFIFTNCYIFFSIEFCTQKSHESINIHIMYLVFLEKLVFRTQLWDKRRKKTVWNLCIYLKCHKSSSVNFYLFIFWKL